MKKIISVILILSILLQTFYGITFLDTDDSTITKFADYDIDYNAFVFFTDVPMATNGVAYRTVGVKLTATENSHSYIIYMPLSEIVDKRHPYYKDDEKWVVSEFHIGLKEIYEGYRILYSNDQTALNELDSFFGRGSVMRVDAILTPVLNGEPQGEVTSFSKDLSTGFTGTIYKTYNEFNASKYAWSETTLIKVKSEYYKVGIRFDPQDVGETTPHITRLLKDGSRVEKVEHTFKEGEVITIDGVNSTFSVLDNSKYIWNYNKVGDSPTEKIIYNPGAFLDGTLPIGDYKVTLKTSMTFKTPWLGHESEKFSENEASTLIHVIPNEAPLITANITAPNEIKLPEHQGTAKVPVNLSTTIKNINLEDIQSVSLTLQTDGGGQPKTQVFTPSLTQGLNTTFNIPYQGQPFTQYFEGKATMTLKGGKKIESNIAKTGTFIYKESSNIPPVPVISMPSSAIVGPVHISGRGSYDKDGEIIDYDFYVPKIGFSSSEDNCDPFFGGTGEFEVVLGVTDNDGAYCSTSEYITITRPYPQVHINTTGYYKENRKISLSAYNDTEFLSKVGDNYTWTITPITGDIAIQNIKMTAKSGKSIDILLKKKGKYLIEVEGTNTYGMTDTEQKIIEVTSDDPPVMVIDANETIYRDENKVAIIKAYDHSYSTDGDYLNERTWSYKFDSDNDGVFTDEMPIQIKTTTTQWDRALEFEVSHVGRYEITLTTKETFGQPTIPRFITASDYKTGTISKIITVNNIKPVAIFLDVPDQKIDITLVTDYEDDDLVNLESRMNQYVSDSYDYYRNVKFNIVSGKKIIGKDIMNQPNINIPKNYTSPYIIAKSKSSNPNNSRDVSSQIEATDSNFVTSEFVSGAKSWRVTRTKQFDVAVKDVKAVQYTTYVLLENGDLYKCGAIDFDEYNLYNERYFDSSFNSSYIKVMTGVKSIKKDFYARGDNSYIKILGGGNFTTYNQGWLENLYVLKNNGTIWRAGKAVISMDRTNLACTCKNLRFFSGYGDGKFYQVQGFNNIVKMEVGYCMVVGMTADHQFYVSGRNVYKAGGYVRSGVKPWTVSSVVDYYENNAEIAVKVTNIESYGFTDIVTYKGPRKYTDQYNDYPDQYKTVYYVTEDKKVYSVVANTGGWELVWDNRGRQYLVVELPFETTVTLLKQFPNDFKRLYDINSMMYFNGTNVLFWNTEKKLISEGIGWHPPHHTGHGDEREDYPGYFDIPPVYEGGWDLYELYPGRNIEVIDVNDATTSAYRPNSNRYFIYLAKGDSFKTATSSLTDFIKAQDLNVYVSCDSKYNATQSDLSSEAITINRLLSVKPNGKKYGLNALENILSDISNLNSIQRAPDGGLYLVYGEDTITYDKFYRDFEGDPKLSEKSKVIHEKDYFENTMGLSVYHNRILTVPLTTFDKVGKFTIEYTVTDKPSTNSRFMNYNKTSEPDTLKVYVHRRPIADFDLTYDYRAADIRLAVNDLSYDLDHQSQANKGITKWEWVYRINAETTWHAGKPTTLNYKDKVEIALTVTDVEGAISKQVQRTYTMPESLPLILKSTLTTARTEFSIAGIPTSETIKLTDIKVNTTLPHGIEVILKSTDGKITENYITYTNNDTAHYTESGAINATNTTKTERHWHDISIEIPKTYKDGDYQIEISLKDLKTSTGLEYPILSTDQVTNTHLFKVRTPVKIIGELTNDVGRNFELAGITGRYSEETFVKLFYGTSYEKHIVLPLVDQSTNTNHLQDTKRWRRNTSSGPEVPAGQYTAHFETKTASGNRAISEVPFDYQPVTVKSFDARGYWNHWRGQTTLKGEVTTIEPHRFLAHECVIFEALIQGEIEGALLRLSPELESMTYWDKYNNLYRYEDDFHMKVYFPVHLKKVGSIAEGDLWQYEYALPYADSTQSFENERLKPSYKATLYVIPKGVDWHGDYTTKGLIQMEIADIDITGNIHDLLYIEPVRGSQ